MTSRDGTLTRLVYSIIPTLKKVIMLSNSCNFDSYHSFLPVEFVESDNVIAPFNFAQFSSDTCATDSLSHNNSPANHNLVAEHIFNDNCFIIGNYQTKDVNQNNTNRTFPSKIKSSKESLHEVRNMFPDPSNRYCVICKRANMSFKKNYFIHAQNAELYQKTFPSTSIMFGPVCSTDFNKVWRYSRGEYIPSADGSGRTIKNLKPSQKRTFSDSTLKRKKIKQSTEIVPTRSSTSFSSPSNAQGGFGAFLKSFMGNSVHDTSATNPLLEGEDIHSIQSSSPQLRRSLSSSSQMSTSSNDSLSVAIPIETLDQHLDHLFETYPETMRSYSEYQFMEMLSKFTQVKVSGYQREALMQIKFETNTGKVYGPYGNNTLTGAYPFMSSGAYLKDLLVQEGKAGPTIFVKFHVVLSVCPEWSGLTPNFKISLSECWSELSNINEKLEFLAKKSIPSTTETSPEDISTNPPQITDNKTIGDFYEQDMIDFRRSIAKCYEILHKLNSQTENQLEAYNEKLYKSFVNLFSTQNNLPPNNEQ
ncbi:predicted protein [Naegleria gruberi]|uniref:Predicted protein n=1 Tax=Naegleria gruberi TaxID=5762 RepID=D2UXE4_NAEGR|nr:uncharacterized protein NAEGRDRAFT_61093 [Naegleria gruberi]EFC50617.1 predicted protein [Naegleria gruberi]|eukprot:XP_002683361.1 predicted protein [Naegleria gruberi strain NEG-M]